MAGGGLFNQLDYSFSVGHETGRDSTFRAPGGGGPALRRQLGTLRRYFERLPLAQLRPDAALVGAAPGAYTQVLSDGRSCWVVYYEPLALRPQPLRLRLPAQGRYQAQWTDVVTGQALGAKMLTTGTLTAPASTHELVLRISPVAKK